MPPCLPQALARLADLLSAPSHEDLVAYFVGEGEEPPELDRWGHGGVGQGAWARRVEVPRAQCTHMLAPLRGWPATC